MKLEICVTLDVNHLAFLGCVEFNCVQTATTPPTTTTTTSL